MQLSTPRALLFDLDGTLVDSLRDIADAMNAVLEEQKLPTHPVDAYRVFVGDGMEMLIRRAHPCGATLEGPELARLVAAMKAAYTLRWRRHPDPYPGIPEFLNRIAQMNLPLGVLSNKPEAFTREMVDLVFPEVPWRTVRGAREGIPVKPAPDAGREILADWGLPAESVWYVGDTRTDMDFATAVGCVPVGVTWGFRDRQELWDHGARVVVDTPAELRKRILPSL